MKPAKFSAADSVNERCLQSMGDDARGFTLVELLVVIATVTALALTLLPVLAKGRVEPQGTQCLSNLRQITTAWKMYDNDNQGFLPPNPGGENWPAWVAGEMRNNDSINVVPYIGELDSSNAALLVDTKFSLLGSYIQNPAVFKDPSDYSTWNGAARVRSFSMNCAIGYKDDSILGNLGSYREYKKESDLIAPSPSDLWVLLDEHPDGINDGVFAFTMPQSATRTTWVDLPSSYHNGDCPFSFADGHAELHKWVYPNVFPPVNWNVEQTPSVIRTQSNNISSNPDNLWLARHTTAPANGQSPYYP